MGLGVLGFSVQSLEEMAPVVEAYKKAIGTAEPVGAFVNDNVMITTAAYVREDAEDAIRDMVASNPTYLQSNVYRYHDTFPHPDWVPQWPDLLPAMTEDMARGALGSGGMVMGTPDHALEACARWESAGADQLVFGIGPDSLDGHARNHPTDRRARDPEARQGPRAPHDALPRRRGLDHLSRAYRARSKPIGRSTTRDRTYSPSPFACGS